MHAAGVAQAEADAQVRMVAMEQGQGLRGPGPERIIGQPQIDPPRQPLLALTCRQVEVRERFKCALGDQWSGGGRWSHLLRILASESGSGMA